MTIDQAKNLILPSGDYKGKRLCELHIKSLKQIAKNCIKKSLRDAAIIVINQRSLDIGVEIQYQPTYKPMSDPKLLEKPVTKGALGSLEELLRNSPEGLF